MSRYRWLIGVLGWCPGSYAYANLRHEDRGNKVSILGVLLLMWILGAWWVTKTAQSLNGVERLFFTNRMMLALVLGGIVVIVYTWKSFKPIDWELPEFNYERLDIEDLPDFPIDASHNWIGGGSGSGLSILREMDVEEYRRKIAYYKELKKKRKGTNP